MTYGALFCFLYCSMSLIRSIWQFMIGDFDNVRHGRKALSSLGIPMSGNCDAARECTVSTQKEDIRTTNRHLDIISDTNQT